MITWQGLKPDEAVSNTLGFVILSGILLTSVAIIFAIGLPVYNNYVGQSHMQNMIEGFDLISENGNNVALLRTPYQQSELKLYGGTLSIKDAGTVKVHCYSDTSGAETSLVASTGSTNSVTGDSVPLRIIEYSKDQSSIAYLLGGVFRKDVGDTTYPVLKNPTIYTYIHKDEYGNTVPVLVIPLISLYDNPYSTEASMLARISFGTLYYSKKDQTVDQPTLHTYNGVKLVRVTFEGCDYDFAMKWYFEEMGFQKDTTLSTDDKLVMYNTYDPGITVNTIQTIVIVTVNSGSV